MKRYLKDFLKRGIVATVSVAMLAQPLAASAALLNFSQTPLFVSVPIPPMVMLDISKDQQLYKKAYNDYSDLDGDGVIETTYNHAIDYYGYFDSYKCYTYNASNKRYEPSVYNTKDTSSGATSGSATNLAAKYCSTAGNQSTTWSGNFLNWATMTRVDAVRKLLYGGLRSPNRPSGNNSDGANLADGDTATSTVLERSFLPNDAHSFAKYYGGADLGRLTPFGPNINSTTSSDSFTIATGGTPTFQVGSTTGFAVGDVVKVASTASPTNYVSATINALLTGPTRIKLNAPTAQTTSGSGTFSAWTLSNLTTSGMTICNTTLGGSSPQDRSQTNTNLPRMRVARGNYALWAANERWQCRWNNEVSTNSSNTYSLSGVPATSQAPDRTVVGLDNKSNTDGQGDYFVRVQACVTGLFGTEKCKEYNTNNFSKPIGLLQVYGENGQIQFGLMTGSYNKNLSGGVLRKNVGTLADEISANGTFTPLATAGVSGSVATFSSGVANPGGGSIITTLNKLRIWGYGYDDGTYIGGGTKDTCDFQQTSITQGQCVSWGNPMSEIYYESLRYFSGATAPTSAFNTDDSTKIAGLATASWPSTATTVLANANYCAPVNLLVFNASVSTNEMDNQIGNPFNGLSFNATDATSTVGVNESVASGGSTTKYFVGRTSNGPSNTAATNEFCDGKVSPNGMGNMFGICPEGPTLTGSYLMAGLAYTAHTNRIRADLTQVPTNDTKSLKVNTYGISLATNVPQLALKLTGESSPRVIIQPAYRLVNPSTAPDQGGGTLVDMQIVSQSVSATGAKGNIYLNWEDSEQGGDYDQDVWGTLSYCMQTGADTTTCGATQGANTVSVTTQALVQSTANGQGFGYVISGTSKDGPHFHSGIIGYSYTDPANITVTRNSGTTGNAPNASGGCNSCQVGDSPTTATYALSASTVGTPLKDPLWYAAKYGGFKDSDTSGTGFNLPDKTAEWDVLKADGTTGSDGSPDNYFLVSNPLGLEKSLNTLFVSILATASASAAAANSSRLITNTKVYQAVFNTQDWSSKLLSFGVDPSTGVPSTTADWDAGQLPKLAASSATANQNSRVILTYNKGVSGTAPTGVPFRWPTNPSSPATTDLSPTQITALKTNPSTGTADTDTIGQNRLLYIRGDGTNEGTSTGDFRPRNVTKLGDIVDSNIAFVGAPSAGYADPAYASFATTYRNRTPMLYVGANDGMMHAFNANTGDEMLGYVPARLFRKLNQLTLQNYSHTFYVDGSPDVEDAFIGPASTGSWKSVLVGGYNAGGQGLYALDVSNPTTTNYTEGNASSLVMWEFTDADDADLGFTYGTPVIRKMANGKWAAIVSGGYNNSDSTSAGEVACTGGAGTVASPYTPAGCTSSRTGSAYLFIIYLDGPSGSNGTWVQGTDYIKIPTPSVTGVSATTPNGLAAPLPVDVNGDGAVDFVYAGDLFGNMWKFDLRNTTASNWLASTAVVSLFTAKDASNNLQPITSRIDWALHPTGVGFVVSFGTGKYMESTDINPPGPAYTTQSVYGIWDKSDNASISSQTTVSGRSVLMQQIVLASSTGSPRYRVLSKFQPNYTSSNVTYTSAQVSSTDPNRPADSTTVAPQMGWYFDLSNSTSYSQGERNVFNPDLQNGIAFYSSLWPTTNACLGAADGDNLVFNIGTGARPDISVFDRDGNGLANTSDFVTVGGVQVPISTLGIQGGASQTPTFIRMTGNTGAPGTFGASGYGAAACSAQSTGIQSTTGGKLSQSIYSFGQDCGRISWREIIND